MTEHYEVKCTVLLLCLKGGDNMKIKVKQNFYDRENDLALREKGAEMEVSEQRGRELINKGFAAEVKPKEEKKTESEN